MDQVTVGTVDFDKVESDLLASFHSLQPLLLVVLDVLCGSSDRLRVETRVE